MRIYLNVWLTRICEHRPERGSFPLDHDGEHPINDELVIATDDNLVDRLD